MYWMLLPPNANAGRHIAPPGLPLSGYWTTVFRAGWGAVVRALAPPRA